MAVGRSPRFLALVLLVPLVAFVAGCGGAATDDLFQDDGPNAGSAGSNSSAGTAGTGGTSASGGAGGSDGGGAGSATGGSGGGSSGSSGAAGTGTAGTGGTGGASGTGPSCEDSTHALPRRDTYLEIALDTSGSMAAGIPGTQHSRLSASISALRSSLGELPPSVRLGATRFPGLTQDSTSDFCYAANQDLPFTVVSDADDAVAGLAMNPRGGTPTQNAVRFGLDRLRDLPDSTTRMLILLTDGVGNYGIGDSGSLSNDCTGDGQNTFIDPAPMLNDAGSAFQQSGIYTVAVALPGSENYRDVLRELGRVGGTETGIVVDDPNEPWKFEEYLAGTFQVVTYAVACGYKLPPGANPDLLAVQLSSSAESRSLEPSDCTDMADGYQYEPSQNTLFLCWATCADAFEKGDEVSVTLMCPPEGEGSGAP